MKVLIYMGGGFDTYGPFKIIGGLKKGHPTEKEIQDAVVFYNGLGARYGILCMGWDERTE